MSKFRVYIFEPHLDPMLSNPIIRLGENYHAKYKFIIQDLSWQKYISSKEIYFIDLSKTNKNEIKKWRKYNEINENILFKDLKNINFQKHDIFYISCYLLWI